MHSFFNWIRDKKEPPTTKKKKQAVIISPEIIAEIKSEYLHGSELEDLAKKYKIPVNSLKVRAGKGHWADLKENVNIPEKEWEKRPSKSITSRFDQCKEIGDIGEEAVKNYLLSAGYQIYTAPDESHPFDLVCVKGQTVFICEIKTRYSQNDGISLFCTEYKKYCEVMKKNNIDFILFFVDVNQSKCYGGKLKDFEISCNKAEKVYFDISKMKMLFILQDATIQAIKELYSKSVKKIDMEAFEIA